MEDCLRIPVGKDAFIKGGSSSDCLVELTAPVLTLGRFKTRGWGVGDEPASVELCSSGKMALLSCVPWKGLYLEGVRFGDAEGTDSVEGEAWDAGDAPMELSGV